MKKDLSTKYDFKAVEKGMYQFWLDKGLFKAGQNKNSKPFTIVIPPPNVTGKLHLGHAWDNTIQDIIIRRKRMQGFDTLYLPGMDHAGLATQAKIEERLRSQGISRYDLGRNQFIEKAWEWKDEFANHIKAQWEALGLSLDYSKERFTLDQKLSEAVTEVFIKLYEKGWIYRGNRIIHWDVEAKTALSNIEVEYQETRGKLYYINYPLTDGTGHLTVATTRPETMFGDQAVMIHPEDNQRKAMIGRKVFIPGTKTEIPVIADSYVDMDFGTGVVKVTPAHDPNDYEVGLRHHLAAPLCMNEDGTMNELAGTYQGLDRFECRKALIKDLASLGLIDHIEDHVHQVGYSDRTGVMVEPRLSLQWFVRMQDLADQTLKNNQVDFIPERFRKTFEHWLTTIQDWCISRQIWWGHRIPAWYKEDQVKVQRTSPGAGWQQEEDVLDTWFSSALWPFSTLGWPNQDEPLFKRYFPTDVLVTGYDIIFFWVARMMMLGLEFTGKDPFKQVLLHGLIRDEKGQKMSKSLGNGVDPMDVIDAYGIDALRYFIVAHSAPGMDTRYSTQKVEAAWNLINKLWNIARFIGMNCEQTDLKINEKAFNIFDQWILTRLSEVIHEADRFYERYEFNEVTHVLQNFVWDEFASWYVELSKISLQDETFKENTQAILLYVLKAILKLMHPFIPFVTEKLFLEFFDEPSIMISSWPKPQYQFESTKSSFEIMKDTIVRVRNLRSEYQVAPSKKLHITLLFRDDKTFEELSKYQTYFAQFLNTEQLTLTCSHTDESAVLIAGAEINIFVKKAGLIDLEKEKETLLKQKESLTLEIKRSKGLLSNKNFLNKAPKEKIALEKEKYEAYQKQYQDVIEKLKNYV